MSEEDVEIFYKQGMSFMGQGETSKAIEFFDRAIGIDRYYLPAWNDKGVALMELHDYPKALECFEQVILLNPNDIMPFYNKGYVQLILGNYYESVKTFEFFLTRYPNKDDFYKYALYLKAQGHYNLDEYDAAHALLEEALLKDKTFKEARDLIIKVLNKQKQLK